MLANTLKLLMAALICSAHAALRWSTKPECGSNEHLETDCNSNATMYEMHCDGLTVTRSKCVVPMCVCNEDFVRGLGGKCVYEPECKNQKCGEHEEAKVVCAGCEKECVAETTCTKQCNEMRCVCKKGFIRLEGNCVPYEQCEKLATAENEHLDFECKKCERNCRSGRPCIVDCATPRSICDNYFARNKKGQCVRPRECTIRASEPNVGHACKDGVHQEFRFYYDDDLDTCLAFTYEGCGGKVRRYHNFTECEGRIRSKVHTFTQHVICRNQENELYWPVAMDTVHDPQKGLLLGKNCADNFCPAGSTCYEEERVAFCCKDQPLDSDYLYARKSTTPSTAV